MSRRLPFLLAGLALLVLATPGQADTPAAPEGVYSDPLPRNWTAPVYPPEAIKAGIGGRVTLAFVVDAEGRLVNPVIRPNKKQPVDPRLGTAVLDAAKQWSFSPALDAGQPAPRAVLVTVGFYPKGRGGKPSVDLPLQLDLAPTVSAKAITLEDPVYPDELLPRKLPGTAEFEFEISVEGKPGAVKVLYASDAAFVVAGIATIRGWTFEPGRQGPLPVLTSKRTPMEFSVEGDLVAPKDILIANGISGFEAVEEKPPVPVALYAPVYPRERLLAGEKGDAEVEFVIRDNGLTDFVTVLSATEPEFGAALAAAVQLWQFRPAAHGPDQPVVTLRVHHWFAPKEKADDPETRLVAAFKAGEIHGGGGLDRTLAPLWRVAPRYPTTLHDEKPAGQATVEFIIDREGRVRLPHATQATREEFGWAAATALSQWVFEPPRRGGQPTDVRVSIPLGFPAPTD